MNCCARWRNAYRQWNVAKPTSVKAKSDRKITDVFARTRREHIAAALRSRFALRIHTSILLLWTFSAGLLTTKALFALGMQSMWLRYTLAIVVAYGAFLLGVRIWLAYVGAGSRGSGGSDTRQADNNGKGSSIDVADFLPSGSGSSGGSSDVFSGGGGSSGGGGASASFGDGIAPPSNLLAMDSAALSASSGGSGGGDSSLLSDVGGKVGDVVGDIGGGDGEGCLIAFAVMIVIGIVALAIGGAVFVISAGPEILIDAAFEALLAGGLIKAARRMHDPDWFGSVIRATWIPFVVVLVLAVAFALTAAALVPQAKTFGEVMSAVMPLLLGKL